MRIPSKSTLLLALAILLGGVTTFTMAQVNVKSDLGNAIQNIQKVYFSPEGIKDPDQDKNILMELKDGAVTIHGKVIFREGENGNTLAPQTTDSHIIHGIQNKIEGNKSIIIGGRDNKVNTGVEKGRIIGGRNNIIESGSEEVYIHGGKDTKIKSGSTSTILGTNQAELEGNHSLIAGGEQITLKGDYSFAAGNRIFSENTTDNTFIRSDNKRGNQNLKPQKSKTFLVRSANGMGINTADPQVKGVDVNGRIQISDQKIECNTNTSAATKFIQTENGACFCTCDGGNRTTMTPSSACQKACNPKATPTPDPDPNPKPNPDPKPDPKPDIIANCSGTKPIEIPGTVYDYGSGTYIQKFNPKTNQYEPTKSWTQITSGTPGPCEYKVIPHKPDPVQPINGKCDKNSIGPILEEGKGKNNIKPKCEQGTTTKEIKDKKNGRTRTCKGESGGNDHTCTVTCKERLVKDEVTKVCKKTSTPIKAECAKTPNLIGNFAIPDKASLCALGHLDEKSFKAYPDKGRRQRNCLGTPDTQQNRATNCSIGCEPGLLFTKVKIDTNRDGNPDTETYSCVEPNRTVSCSGEMPNKERYLLGKESYTQTWDTTTMSYSETLKWEEIMTGIGITGKKCKYAERYFWDCEAETKPQETGQCISDKGTCQISYPNSNRTYDKISDNICTKHETKENCENATDCRLPLPSKNNYVAGKCSQIGQTNDEIKICKWEGENPGCKQKKNKETCTNAEGCSWENKSNTETTYSLKCFERFDNSISSRIDIERCKNYILDSVPEECKNSSDLNGVKPLNDDKLKPRP